MIKPKKSSKNIITFVPIKGQGDFPSERFLFSDETLQSLAELGEILKKIDKRLDAEGYAIQDGKIVKKLDIIKW